MDKLVELWATQNDGIFDLGRGDRESHLPYYTCPCRDKHFLPPDSRLLQYLKFECQGFTEDPKGEFSLNYILIVLVTNWSQKGLFKKRNYLTTKNRTIKALLGYPCWGRPISIKISNLRYSICSRYFRTTEVIETSYAVFFCVKDQGLNIYHSLNNSSELIDSYCRKEFANEWFRKNLVKPGRWHI